MNSLRKLLSLFIVSSTIFSTVYADGITLPDMSGPKDITETHYLSRNLTLKAVIIDGKAVSKKDMYQTDSTIYSWLTNFNSSAIDSEVTNGDESYIDSFKLNYSGNSLFFTYSEIADTKKHSPVATITIPKNYYSNTELSFGADESFDVDGDAISCKWKLISLADSSSTYLSDSTYTSTSFFGDRVGEYTLLLTVTDKDGMFDTDTAFVTVIENPYPALKNPYEFHFTFGDSVIVNGAVPKDVSLDSLKYSWTVHIQPAGSDIVSDTTVNSAKLQFLPKVTGYYVFTFDIRRLWSVDSKYYMYKSTIANIYVE